ncbi:MAG: rod shape-determining protein MreD [Spirochaetaceae bacterium]|nr:MAG: rod shape-determining protein MreD [Spirochaetaceae bacterium]
MIGVYGALVLAAAAVIQSTLLPAAAVAGVTPDLVLVVLVFVAQRNGVMTGQTCGFVAGLVVDAMGLAPLGFYALSYTVIGAAVGATRGKVFVDPIVMPFVFIVAAMVVKGVIGFLVAWLFGIAGVAPRVFSGAYLIEIAYSGLLAPVLFGLLGLAKWLRPDRRRGEIA